MLRDATAKLIFLLNDQFGAKLPHSKSNNIFGYTVGHSSFVKLLSQALSAILVLVTVMLVPYSLTILHTAYTLVDVCIIV